MITMNKIATTACLAAAFGLCAHADYVWNGGATITPELWAQQSSWILTDGTTWTGLGSGPGTQNSNMWGGIVIADAAGTVGTFEGWNATYRLTNTQLTVTQLRKLQGGCTIDIDKDSSFTIDNFSGANDGGVATINNDGQFNITLGKHAGSFSGASWTFHLGEAGIINVDGAYTLSINSLTAQLPEVGSSATGAYETHTRRLITLADGASLGGNLTFTHIADGEGYTQVAGLDDFTAAGQYCISRDATGLTLTYSTAAPAPVAAIPEPTTATLSLLALAGLAVRRRRS